MLTEILAVVSLIVAGLAAIFRARAKQHKAEAEQQRQRAEMAETTSATHARIDKARADTQQRHREEQRDEQARLDAGRRDHMDDRW